MRFGEKREERLVTLYAELKVQNSVNKMNNEFSRVEELLKDNAPVAEQLLDRPERLRQFVEHIVREDTLVMGGCVAVRPGYLPYDMAGHIAMEYVYRNDNGEWRQKHLGDSTYDYTRMQWFTDAIDARGAVWSEPYFDRGAGDEMMVTCSYPLRDESGTTVAVLTADISLNTLREEISRLRPIDDSYAFILSDKGVFVAHPDGELVLNKDIFTCSKESGCEHIAEIGRDMMAQHKGTRRMELAGEDVLVVYEPIPGTGWSICSVCDYGAVMSQLDLITIRAVVLLIIGLVLLAILIRLVIVYSMKPLHRLTGAASKISAGDLDAQLPEMKASDEIGRLNNAFAEMQTSLKHQMEQLVETTRAKEHIESELHIARSIQMGLVPHSFSPFPEWKGLELFAMLRPAKEVGGDLYDFFIRDARIFFAIGDVSGKGVPASLFMAVTRTLFRMTAGTCDSPKEIMTRLNDTVIKDNDECMFVTMFIGVLDLATGELRFCNAGHNRPVTAGPHGVRMIATEDNIPAGVMEGYGYEEESLTLRPDELFFLYTDGLTEAENSRKELFGDERMLSVLETCCADTPRECIARVEKEVVRFAGDVDQSDDLTMLCFRLDYIPANGGNTSGKPKTDVQKKVFDNSMSIVAEIPAISRGLVQDYGLDDEDTERLNLMLEEALVNVVSYAYPEGEKGEIELLASFAETIDGKGSGLAVEIIDSGKPFDPTAAAEPDTEAPAEDRTIGGLGIFLIRSLADSVDYRREDGRNHLRFTIGATRPGTPVSE